MRTLKNIAKLIKNKTYRAYLDKVSMLFQMRIIALFLLMGIMILSCAIVYVLAKTKLVTNFSELIPVISIIALATVLAAWQMRRIQDLEADHRDSAKKGKKILIVEIFALTQAKKSFLALIVAAYVMITFFFILSLIGINIGWPMAIMVIFFLPAMLSLLNAEMIMRRVAKGEFGFNSLEAAEIITFVRKEGAPPSDTGLPDIFKPVEQIQDNPIPENLRTV